MSINTFNKTEGTLLPVSTGGKNCIWHNSHKWICCDTIFIDRIHDKTNHNRNCGQWRQ
jgi:uncharacterized membrane protein (UPF0127 family)